MQRRIQLFEKGGPMFEKGGPMFGKGGPMFGKHRVNLSARRGMHEDARGRTCCQVALTMSVFKS